MEKEKDTKYIGISKRIKDCYLYLLSNKKVEKQGDIATQMGIDNGNVSKAFNGNKRYLTKPFIEKFANQYGFNKDWLWENKGEMLNTPEYKEEVTAVPEDDYMMVEFEDLETAAGKLGGGIVDILPEKKTRLVPREYKKGYYLVVRVHGHSMDDNTKRSISEGEEILIKQCFEQYFNLPIRNKLFVIVTNSGSVIKQISKIDTEKEEITCHSFNPMWEDYTIPFEEILQLFTVEKKVKSNIFF